MYYETREISQIIKTSGTSLTTEDNNLFKIEVL